MNLKQAISKQLHERENPPIGGRVAQVIHELGGTARDDLDEAIIVGVSARVIAASLGDLGHSVTKGHVEHYVAARKQQLKREGGQWKTSQH